MKTNKNGIPIHTPGKRINKRVPLEYASNMITFTKIVSGITVDITVPKSSEVSREFKKDGWRIAP